ncbi:MAG: thioredoxin domain-containing protein, partial [Candidatus Portnoybacteria bacterium CG11_big_fil_rev_8_21_14_0_20_44_10]
RTDCEAYQVTKNPFYAKVAREILDYVLRDLTDAEGGFYSAEDADSLDPDSTDAHKKEGAFYLWRADEIKQALGEECAKIFNYHFGIKKNGNAHSDPHNE